MSQNRHVMDVGAQPAAFSPADRVLPAALFMLPQWLIRSSARV